VPTFREITDLRKSGDLKGARTAALAALEAKPHDSYLQGAYGWVLYEEIKRTLEALAKEEITVGKLINAFDHIAREYQSLDALKRRICCTPWS